MRDHLPGHCGSTTTCEIDTNEVDTDNDKRRQLRLREGEDCVEAIKAHCICTHKNSGRGRHGTLRELHGSEQLNDGRYKLPRVHV